MTKKRFDTSLTDSQATAIERIPVEQFDFNAYAEYEAALGERCAAFTQVDTGVLVHRRMRVTEVFSFGCRDMKQSLAWQLGAMQESVKYKADVPNFLEPWYGIGTAASAFGIDYSWPEGQAPVVSFAFKNVEEALQADFKPIEKTAIGIHTLNMIDYFLEKTKGKLPMSVTDSQSPLNVATFLIPVDAFVMDLYTNPEGVGEFLKRISQLTIDFYRKQEEIIGDCLVKPGHGFASSRHFKGNGFSDDMIHMLTPELYQTYIQPSLVEAGDAFSGAVFHSCGNWSKFVEVVREIPELVSADGAFSKETDPDPNPCKPFAEAFAGTGIVLNARMVGDVDTVTETVSELWKPGMKMIAVTYCETPEEQETAYQRIHEICN